jgi:hypothetical protein
MIPTKTVSGENFTSGQTCVLVMGTPMVNSQEAKNVAFLQNRLMFSGPNVGGGRGGGIFSPE